MINPTIIKFDTLESTNDLLKTYFESFPDLTFVQTHFQTKGRGQFDHTWDSNKDENLLFSVLLKEAYANKRHQIKDIILNTLFTFFNEQEIKVHFKEPNDLFVGDEKICGILIETRYEESHLDYMIIGIGLNVNQLKFNGYKATSMKLIHQKDFEIDVLFARLVDILTDQLNSSN